MTRAKQPTRVRVNSEAQRRLLEANWGPTALGRHARISKQAASKLLLGLSHAPSPEVAARLEKEIKLPAALWRLKPGASEPSPTASSAPARPRSHVVTIPLRPLKAADRAELLDDLAVEGFAVALEGDESDAYGPGVTARCSGLSESAARDLVALLGSIGVRASAT